MDRAATSAAISAVAHPADTGTRGEQQGGGRATTRARCEDDSQQAQDLRSRRMKVGTRLRGAFAFYIALLAAVLVYHVRTTQHAVDSGRALTDISTRFRLSSTAQDTRLMQMSS